MLDFVREFGLEDIPHSVNSGAFPGGSRSDSLMLIRSDGTETVPITAKGSGLLITDALSTGSPTPAMSLSSGSRHTCAVKSAGSLECWGDSSHRSLLDAPHGSFRTVAAGDAHTCALKRSGDVACWGENGQGQSNAPAGEFTAVSARSNSSCGVRIDGTLACWGNLDKFDPPPGSFTSVSVGRDFACGLRTDRTIACWGNNRYTTSASIGGQIVTIAARSKQLDAPAGTFTSISVGAGLPGNAYSCGVRTDSTLACWGNSKSGQLDPPQGTFSAVVVGDFQTCGIRRTGSIVCRDAGRERSVSGVFIFYDGGLYAINAQGGIERLPRGRWS